ncbi:allophanate hydrolase subunit 1 [Cellulomonas palmilytica]|nr:allophanate hydrolase subunit 1 [Cellulomonas palmilytica]
MRVRRFGDAALLVELPDLAAVRRVDDALRAARATSPTDPPPLTGPSDEPSSRSRAFLVKSCRGTHDLASDARPGARAATERAVWAGVEDQVPAAESVLLRVRAGTDLRALARAVRQVAADALDSDDAPATDRPLVVLPVTYDGPDLDDVAAATGLTVDALVARHAAATYTVAFGGFMPGFAYLVGLDPALVVPRLATPRPRVPAGAVAIADRFTAVYPAATPGGWRLLGSCPTSLFDVARDEPALLTPGTRVRFEVAG